MSVISAELIRIYRGRRVLVTGHTGFKGSWLCTWLAELGAQVTGVGLAPDTKPALFDAAGVANHLTSLLVDIRDMDAIRRTVESAQPEIVFHLAAQSLVRRSYTDPLETFATNVLGTAHVLEACRNCASIKAVVTVTTDKVYDNREWDRPYREIDPLGGTDPYSASKAAAEIVAAVYQKNLCRGRAAIATARGGNVIGGGDWADDRIIPDIVRALSAGAPIVLRNPDAVRPWQHVLELCEAYLELGARLFESSESFAEAWNFGPHASEHVTVAELTMMILEIWGCPEHRLQVQPSPLHEAKTLRLDISKALSRLSWKPKLNIRDAVSWTADWYKQFYQDPLGARANTLRQIHSFVALSPGQVQKGDGPRG
jgi:CDP-glucose 4,6-dehydratase